MNESVDTTIDPHPSIYNFVVATLSDYRLSQHDYIISFVDTSIDD